MGNKWNNIETVIVVLKDDSAVFSDEFFEEINALGKRSKIVVLSEKKEEVMNDQPNNVRLTSKDFNWLNKPKSENAKTIFAEEYDLLIAIDAFEGKSKKRIQKLKTNLKIAFNLDEQDTFFDINMTTTSNSIKHLINFTKEIIEKIK